LVDLLFLAFVIVQFRYLFGGAEMVAVTPGLTYADYAREGFFQLVVATALGLPWLLAADSLLSDRKASTRWGFRALAGMQLLLLLAIVASAIHRMRAYLEAYGQTEDRFVATAILVWLALLVAWFGITVLRGCRTEFALGALFSGYVLVAFLHFVNPTAIAVRSHLDRASVVRQEPGATSQLDGRYLSYLGSDATPILVHRLDELDPEARAEVAGRLLARWGPDGEADWRNWNLADWRARQTVRDEADRLTAMTQPGEEGRLGGSAQGP
jgi:hypothetical protein